MSIKKVTIAALIISVIAFSSFIAFKGDTASPEVKGGYTIGDIVADFELKNVDEKMVGLTDYTANQKGAIVIFTCIHCPYAKAYEERIIELDKQFRDKGYPVIAINPNTETVADDSFENMQKIVELNQYPFPYLADDDQSVAKAFGATKTPHVYVLSKEEGGLSVEFIGAIDDSARDAEGAKKFYVADAVNSLLAGKVVNKKEVPAVGCTIKWSK
ncbi:MAG: thioredoxin family protein [Bacteroidota bacterium]